jgi:hypothetical protein
VQICHWEVHPLLLGCPPNKSEDAYQLMLDAVLRKINRDGREDFKPNTLSEDFESEVIKILKARFPSSKISGCTFHMRQAIWRKLQELTSSTFSTRMLTSRSWSAWCMPSVLCLSQQDC